MRIKTIFTALALLVLLAGCVPIPEPMQPAGAVGTFSEDAYFEHDVSVAGNLTVAGTTAVTGATTYGANLVFEGATADAYETTFAITDPTSSDKTITFPNSTGTVALNPYGASIEFEGTTADEYELTLTVTDPATIDKTVTIPQEDAAVMVSSLTTNATDAANSVTGATNGLRFEGATANDFELSLTVADPTTPDKTVTLPDATGTVMLSTLATNAPDAANAVTGGTNQLIFEGATGGADAFETVITPADPTADNTVTLANASGTVMLSSLATNAPDAANSVTGASNGLIFEGSAADANETTVSATNPTAARSVVLPDAGGTVMLSSLATNGADAANAVTGVSNGLLFEGATGGADAFETTLTVTDPTADRTVTIQDATGTVALTSQAVDMTLTATTNGNNAADRNEFIGLPRIKYLGLATGVDGTDAAATTVNYIDATPTGEWVEIDGGTNIAVTADTSIYKDVTNSLKIAFTDVVDNEGVDGTIAQDDLSTNEWIGFWLYSSVATEGTHFDLTLDDTDGTDQVYAVPAVAANTWTWIEIDISGCDANCDTTDGIKFLATATGGTALTAANVYLDGMYKWDTDAEEAIALALQTDGVLGCVKLTDGTPLIEYTGFFVAYRTGVDALVYITNESADVHACLFAY